jgi:hypothetical protein
MTTSTRFIDLIGGKTTKLAAGGSEDATPLSGPIA